MKLDRSIIDYIPARWLERIPDVWVTEIRRTLLSIGLMLERRMVLIMVVDGLILFTMLISVMTGGGGSPELYRGAVLPATIVVGALLLGDLVAVERRSGTLDVALTSPGAGLYFERRALSVAVLIFLQALVVLLFARLFLDPFPLLPVVIYSLILCLLVASIGLFWAVRVSSVAAVVIGTIVSTLLLGRWTLADAVSWFKFGSSVHWSREGMIAWLQGLAVLGVSSILFYAYSRRRLSRPESLLGEN